MAQRNRQLASRLRTSRRALQNTAALTKDPEQRRRRHSANKVLTIIKAALNLAYHDGHVRCSDEAWRRVRPFKGVDVARVRFLYADEARRLVNACDRDFRPLVQAALLCGARYGELTSLEVGDFERDAGTIFVRYSKNGHPRHIPLSQDGVDFFDRLTVERGKKQRMFLRDDGKPWGTSHQRRRLQKAAKAAGVEDVSFHILRHTYGSALAMRGVSMRVIAEALGHRDTRITEKRYASIAPSYVAATIRRELPPLGALKEDEDVVVPIRRV